MDCVCHFNRAMKICNKYRARKVFKRKVRNLFGTCPVEFQDCTEGEIDKLLSYEYISFFMSALNLLVNRPEQFKI